MNNLFQQLDIDLDDIDIEDLDLDPEAFDFDDILAESDATKTDTVVVRRYPRPNPYLVKYERASEMAAAMADLEEGDAVFSVVSGNFIFGDFIEAYMVEKNYYAEEIIVATLSLGKENVDSLANLLQGDYVGRLSLIVSDFWFAHERRKNGGVPYIMDTLGGDNFRFAAAGLHTKITLIRTSAESGNRHLVLHGSANLRSSRNVEQFVLENNRTLYEFNRGWLSNLIDNFAVKNKSTRGNKLWQQVQEPAKKADSATGEKDRRPQANAAPGVNKPHSGV